MRKRTGWGRGARGAAVFGPLLAGAALVLPGCGGLVSAPSPELWKPVAEITIFFGVFLLIFWFMRGTRGENILKGIATLVLFAFLLLFWIAQRFGLVHVTALLEGVLSTSILALIIIFQPELRRGLVRLGDYPFMKILFKREVNVIDEIVESVVRLAKKKVGALIAIQREVGLNTYIEGGERIDAAVRSTLIDTVFFPGTALHDGAIVIQDERIAAAGCLFPLTDNPSISKTLGTRHRAAIGLTEDTDAVTVVVSEETGQISVGVDGELHRNLDKEGLEAMLKRLILTGEGGGRGPGGPRPRARERDREPRPREREAAA